MSLIVARSSPFFGFVSASNERRWISIRCGSSRGCGRREKFLRVTGAAADRANWATPQVVGDAESGARDSGQQRAQRRATHKYIRCVAMSSSAAHAQFLLQLDATAGLFDLGLQLVALLAVDAL